LSSNGANIVIANYQPQHLSRILEITSSGFSGVSIDYWAEQHLGYVAPGWQERKLADVRRTINDEPSGVFVALAGGEVVGYVTVETYSAKKLGRIVDLAVDAQYRRQGLGSRLITRGLEYMKERGMNLAKIETLTTNEAGQAAYPKMGFKEVARQIHYVMPLK
jgi:ribosomal protein S18 acetylase RimI-like enzyme